MMMLKVPSSSSCNVADRPLALSNRQCRLLGASSLGTVSIRRRNAVWSCLSSSDGSPILAVANGEPNGRDAGFERSWADRLRPGSLEEDGLSYKEKFIVRCYEVGINKNCHL